MTLWAWIIVQLPIFVIAFGAYSFIALRGATQAEGTISPGLMLLFLPLTCALTFGLACIHEGVHGIVMLAFGGRPKFGILKTQGIPIGMYATAPGHRFSRRQYLFVCLAPLAVLAPLGIPACWLPIGGYLVIPFAVHLAGCVGDVTVAWHVLRAPSDAVCEDMRDGTRFWNARTTVPEFDPAGG